MKSDLDQNNQNQKARQELDAFLRTIFSHGPTSIVLTEKAVPEAPYRKAVFRLVSVKGEQLLQCELLSGNKAFHKNMAMQAAMDYLQELMGSVFRQLEARTSSAVWYAKITKRGALLTNRKTMETVLPDMAVQHDRKKQYLLPEDGLPAVFAELGVATAEGRVLKAKFDKFKQINHFLSALDQVLRKDHRSCLRVLDFGCGKSYLTFILYYYLTEILHKTAEIVGLDRKRDVIDQCNALSEQYGYTGLAFACGDIAEYKADFRPDLVVSLHACDTATDDALFRAYCDQADYIFSVPCCQHEMNQTMAESTLSLLTDYGLIKERFCALATDAVRAKLLEYCGYRVELVEFIDFAHSPKNILIRAVKKETSDYWAQYGQYCKAEEFFRTFPSEHTLFQKIMAPKKILLNGVEYHAACGKESMLFRDAAKVRRAVFVEEQGVAPAHEYDDHDHTCYHTVIYRGRTPCATGRMLLPDSDGTAFLGRIAVLPADRTKGLGRAVMDVLMNRARQCGATRLALHAQVHAVPFYEKTGFHAYGEVFEEESIPHISMEMPLEV